MKKLFSIIFSFIFLTACGENKTAVKDFSHFKDMTYADFIAEYGNEAAFVHYVYYSAPTEENIYAVFEGEFDLDIMEAKITEESKVSRIESTLNFLTENTPHKATTEDFIKNLAHDENTEIICEILEGAGTAYYVNDFYLKVIFDDKDETTENLCLDISLTADGKLITGNAYTWLYWN